MYYARAPLLIVDFTNKADIIHFGVISQIDLNVPITSLTFRRGLVDSIMYIVAMIDFAISLYFFHALGLAFFKALVVGLFFLLGMFSFRVYEIKNLKSLLNQILRVFVGIAAYNVVLHILSYGIPWIHVIELSVVLSLVNLIAFVLLLKLVPERTYIVDADDFKDLEGIFKEIEEKTLGKIHFKPANPHILEYPREDVVATSQNLQEILKNSPAIYELAERYLKRIPVEIIERFEEHYHEVFSSFSDYRGKRFLDIVVSAAGLILFSPIMLLAALLIFIEDGRPIVFKQKRYGKNREVFVMYKFRSMLNDKNCPGGKFATDEEHRIMKTGKLMRTFRIDEVLQFINVLKGDMSVVGPRPEQIDLAEKFEKEITPYKFRYAARPGITGWAQLRYKYATNTYETMQKLSYDLWYIKNESFLLDILIMLQTPEAMLFRRGAK